MLILELLGGLLCQLALDLIFMSAAELFWQSVYQQFRPARQARWWVASLGLALFGAFVGFGSAFFLQQRIMPTVGLPGMSLVIAPVLTAIAAWAISRFMLEPNGIEPSPLFTWWGAGIFAFFVAATRFIAVS